MVLRLATHAMGTRFELVLAGDDPVRLRGAGEEALREVEEVDRRLSLFRRDSLLAHVNRTAATGPVRLDADTFELFALADRVARASDGAFDPTVAPLMRALGLHGDESTAPALEWGRARAALGWREAVRLDPPARTVHFTRPDTTVDLGGIAKGHGLDLAAAALRECGVSCALLHGGTSTVVALGAPPGRPGWRVAVGPGEAAPVALLRGDCLSVSTPTGRVAPGPTGEEHHVLDPRTGAGIGAGGARLAATLAPTAALADAWSTALLVAPDLAGRAELESVLLTGRRAPSWRHTHVGPPRFSRVPHPSAIA